MNFSFRPARAAVSVVAAAALVTSALIATPAFAIAAPPSPAGPSVSGAPAVSEIRWTGEAGGDLGFAASRSSCDVNGDGFLDTIVGDWWWKRGNTANAGAAYVLLGGAEPVGGPIGRGTAVGAVRIDGPNSANAFAGLSVSCLGDVNGDGLDDVILGSNRTQRTWVVLGAKDFEPVDVDTIGGRGFEVTNSAAVAENAAPGGSANFGYAVSGLGDVNGDGLADFAITDNLYDRPANPETGAAAASNIGRVWVIAGSGDVTTIDVAADAHASRVLFTIDGSGGQIISAEDAGDVNGDGLADIVLGSYGATPWGPSAPVAGAAYAVFGATTRQSVDVAHLGTQGFAVYGPQRGRDRIGTSIAAIGDINGDGKADFVVGGDGVPNAATGPRAGGAAVVLGSESTQTVFTTPGASENAVYHCAEETTNASGACAGATVPRGYWIDGAVDNDKFGWSAAGVEDLNGDGVPEIVLGAWGQDSGGTNAGALYVVYGTPGFSGTIATAALDSAAGFRIDGAAAGAQLGRSVGGIGDFDGNGVPDLVGGANGTDYASVYLLGATATEATLETAGLTVATGGTLTARIAGARAGAGVPSGTVSFAQAGVLVPGCEAIPVAEGVAHCNVTSLPRGGAQTFSAAFEDSSMRFSASTAELTSDVEKLVSSTVLSGDAVATAQDELEFIATVPSDATGEVVFTAGSTALGTAPIQNGTATLAYSSPVATTFQLSVRYAGDARYGESSSKPRRITIGLVPVTLSAVTVDATKAVYGVRPSAAVRVSGAASGTVLFTAGSRELGTATVNSAGRATLRLPTLPVGSYRVAAEYIGDDTFADTAKRYSTGTLQISKASVRSAKVTTKAAKYGTRPTVTVTLGKLNSGAYPTGRVVISFGAAKKTVTLTAANKGVIRVQAPKALKATVKVTAQFQGSKNITATSASATQQVAAKPLKRKP
ncbi:Ig-like domain repeat protein [Leucobacter luti]|uniref:Ig-like domain repeat protein n=1 Tax=Leucobacter luti TaxID=340320 RepID=UPI001C68975B|nr:Ig-like domain repeat protein [Leucobacter luti]QYM75750.1 Ig-like domain repeat protein [Leucobacter luti]